MLAEAVYDPGNERQVSRVAGNVHGREGGSQRRCNSGLAGSEPPLVTRATQLGDRLRQWLPLGKPAERAAFWVLILVGAAVRLVWLGDIPLSLHQDEASIGYEAWALLEYGVSKHGYPWPVHFIAWGSGQNALYAYLCMPFIKLLGLNSLAIRLPQALLGVAALFAIYAVGRQLVDRRFALCALFVLVVSPWHIMLSRWGNEGNILPVFVLFAFALLLRGLERPRYVVAAFAVLALAPYAYGTAYVFVPLFVLGILGYGWRRHLAHIRHWILGLAVMAVVALPMGVFLVVNLFDLPGIELPLFSIPRYTGTTRFVAESVFFAEHPLSVLLYNAKVAFRILVVDGHTPFIHNALPEFGYFYHPVGLYITLAGAGLMMWDLASGRRPRNTLVALWLGAGIITAMLAEPHLNRLNVLFLPLLLCAAYGLSGSIPHLARPAGGDRRANANNAARGSVLCLWAWWTVNILRVAALAYLAISFAAFTRHYFVEYGSSNYSLTHPSYGQALAHVVENVEIDEVIHVPEHVLYTLTLFYDPPDPRLFLKTVQFRRMDVNFQEPLRFGRYRMGIDADAVANGNAFVVPVTTLSRFDTSDFTITTFDQYSAVIRRR